MREDDSLTLIVDGVDCTDDCGSFAFATPVMAHDIPDEGRALSRVLGPKSFTILVSAPSDRLFALVDGGSESHEVKIVAAGASVSITHLTHFHKGWVGADGVRKMFGSLAPDREREAKWVEELPARASAATAEGK